MTKSSNVIYEAVFYLSKYFYLTKIGLISTQLVSTEISMPIAQPCFFGIGGGGWGGANLPLSLVEKASRAGQPVAWSAYKSQVGARGRSDF